MDIVKFKEIIKQRDETNDEWTYGVEQCWKQEIEILVEDIPSTIDYLKNNCTAEEYSWISEVIEDIVEKNPNTELVTAFKNLKNKYPEEYGKYRIDITEEGLDAILDWEEEHGKNN